MEGAKDRKGYFCMSDISKWEKVQKVFSIDHDCMSKFEFLQYFICKENLFIKNALLACPAVFETSMNDEDHTIVRFGLNG